MEQKALSLIPVETHPTLVCISGHGFVHDSMHRVYTVYILQLECQASQANWLVYRRYRDFERLARALKSTIPKLPTLPPKQLFGSFAVDFIQKRQRRANPADPPQHHDPNCNNRAQHDQLEPVIG